MEILDEANPCRIETSDFLGLGKKKEERYLKVSTTLWCEKIFGGFINERTGGR